MSRNVNPIIKKHIVNTFGGEKSVFDKNIIISSIFLRCSKTQYIKCYLGKARIACFSWGLLLFISDRRHIIIRKHTMLPCMMRIS